MSTRTKKTTTVKTTTSTAGTSQMSTPIGQRIPTPARGERPPSPVMITRVQEKDELAGLNDRLAAYIDRMRFLENENRQLSTQIQSHEETVTREVTNIKALYESELADARKLLDETAKDKAKLQIENNKLKADNAELKTRNNELERDLAAVERRLLAAEAQVNELQARLNDAVNQRKHWETEYNKTKTELNKISKQLDTAKKQLEDETVHRVDLENRVQSLKEELAFNTQVHEQELNETRTRVQVSIDETDAAINKEYESKLADALRQMRAENDYQIRITREETQEVFEKKLGDMKRLSSDHTKTLSSLRNELITSKKLVDDLNSQLSGKDKTISQLEARVRQLEARLASELREHEAAVDLRDAEIARLKQALEDQLAEYRDLLDVKIALDMEIAAYRKLLEAEETRLNISSASEATPRRSGPLSKKRKRTAEESFGTGTHLLSSKAHKGYEAVCTTKGDIEVCETDEEGKFIKLHNTSTEKDIMLAGYQLKHIAGEEETVYKFHRTVQIKAGQYCTVYSSTVKDVTHSPPSELVMKSQKWFTADNMTSSLINQKGKEVAVRQMKKSQERTTYSSSYSGGAGSSRFREGDPQDEKCVIQ